MPGFSDELSEAEEEGEDGRWNATQGDDEGEPASIGVGALAGDASEDGEHEQGGDRSYEEDGGAGG